MRQSLSVQNKWKINDDGKTPVWDKYDTRMVGKATTDYELPDGTTLKVTIIRTHRDATSISERQREVWNITASINRIF